MEENNTITFKRKNIWKYSILLILIIAAVLFLMRYKSSNDRYYNNSTDDNTQKITLSYKNYNYYPNIIRAKVGIPVVLTLDKSISGCYREFVIPDLGVDETSSSPSDTIQFTPQNKGTFKFRCGMGMGTGVLIVE